MAESTTPPASPNSVIRSKEEQDEPIARPKSLNQQLLDEEEKSTNQDVPPSSSNKEQSNLQRASPNPPPHTSPPAPGLPPLPYSLCAHKLSISLIWTLLAIDVAILPLALFYPLWFATRLKPAYIFAITTSVFGIISGIEWAFRSWRLWRREDARPLADVIVSNLGDEGLDGDAGRERGDETGKGRWRFDFFHWMYTIGYTVALIELIIGAAPHQPIVRLCALPAPTFVLFFGILILLFAVGDILHLRTPLRISSQPKGSPFRPAIYWILEDVIAVDTGVGKKWRRRLAERWEASAEFRKLLRWMGWFWGIGAVIVGVGCLVVVVHAKVDRTIAYGIGWGVPPVWATLWALITVKWTQVSLDREARQWTSRSLKSERMEEANETVTQENNSEADEPEIPPQYNKRNNAKSGSPAP